MEKRHQEWVKSLLFSVLESFDLQLGVPTLSDKSQEEDHARLQDDAKLQPNLG